MLNRVILSSDSALKFAIYLKGGILYCVFFISIRFKVNKRLVARDE